MPKCRKPTNILEALHARQLGCPNELVESIFRETCEDLMMGKKCLRRMIRRRVYSNASTEPIKWVVPSPDGTRAAFVQRCYLKIVNISERKMENTFCLTRRCKIMWVSWSPMSKGANYVIAASYSNGNVWVWFSDGRPDCGFRAKGGYEYIISFHPNALVLAIVSGADLIFWDIENDSVNGAPCKDDECIIFVQYAPTGTKLLMSKEVELDRDSCYILQFDLVDGFGVEDLQNNALVLKYACEKVVNITVNEQYTMLAAYQLVDYNRGRKEIEEYVIVVSLRQDDLGAKLYQIRVPQSPGQISFSPTSKYLMFKNNRYRANTLTIVDIKNKAIKNLGRQSYIMSDNMFIWSPNIDIGILMFCEETCNFLR